MDPILDDEELPSTNLETMKIFKADLILIVGLLILYGLILLLTKGQSEISIHDTYLLFDKLSFFVFTIGPLWFLMFLIRAWRNKFSQVSTNIGLFIGVLLMLRFSYAIMSFWSS